MCVGRCVTGCYLCSGGVPKASSSFFSPDEAPPSRLRGSGEKEKVKLRGGVCRLRKGEEPLGSERRLLGVVQFGGTVGFEACSGFEAGRKGKGGKELRGPGCCVSLESASRGGDRQVQPASNDGASGCPCSPHGSTTSWNPMDPACRSPAPRFGLVW